MLLWIPIILQRRAEQILWLRDRWSGAKSQLGLVCVLVLRLTLQRSIDGDRNLLHCCWLQEGEMFTASNSILSRFAFAT